MRGTGWWEGGGWLERSSECGGKKAGNKRKNETEKEVDLNRVRWSKRKKVCSKVEKKDVEERIGNELQL